MARMLHVDPHKRLTASDVLNHPWIAQRDNLPSMRLTLQNPAEVKVLTIFYHKIPYFKDASK